ncbi:MAG TPA: SdpI family protein [Gemmatimonadales bacterium]|nr:SdpI family protein [Gemmatimonadales bacterium]
MRKLLPGMLATLAALGFGLWALPGLPDQVATHWGLNGEPDGWSSRTTAVVLLPLLGLGIAALLAFLPRTDPRRKDFELHADTYWLVANASLIVISAIHTGVIGFNLGWPIPLSRVVAIGIGGLFVLIGNVMTRMRPNWFMGIRTPWTLSSDLVWRKTHRMAGYGFVSAGILVMLAGLLRPEWASWVMIISIAVTAFGSVVYSYLLWREEREDPRPDAGG